MDPFFPPTNGICKVVKVIMENPSTFGRNSVYKCLPVIVNYTHEEGGVIEFTEATEDRAIYCATIDNNFLIENKYYLAYQVSPDTFIIQNQAAFIQS